MDRSVKLPPFEVAFAGLYSSSQEQKHQNIKNEQQPTYQGISVQALRTPFHVYHSQSDRHNNNPDPFGLLNKYKIASLTHTDQEDPHGTDISEVPQSGLDEYSSCHSDTNPLDDALSSIPDIRSTQQVCILGSKPEVNEPIPVSHSDPDYQLTNLPDMLSNPQNSRPVTVVSPQNQNQTTSDNQTPQAEEDVSANTSAVRRQKCYQNYSDHSERRRVRQRERYRNDPDLAKSRRERYKNDPDYAERIRERQRQLRKNPAYVEREKQRKKEFRKDPAYVERQNRLLRERRKERRKDPAYVERQREYQREYRRKRLREFRKDPACAAVAYTNSTF